MPRKNKKSNSKLKELVVIKYVSDEEEAQDYETLLKNNDIPVVIRKLQSPQDDYDKSLAIMVPEDCLDEAHVVVESQDAYDDFGDFTSDYDGKFELDNDIFDDEF